MADTEPNRHPFLQGLSKHRGAPPTVVVIFGASGDLTARKLIPAVYNLSYDNLLPADFFLIGFGRKPIPDGEFRKIAAGAVEGIFAPRVETGGVESRGGQHVLHFRATTTIRAAFKKPRSADRSAGEENRAANSIIVLYFHAAFGL